MKKITNIIKAINDWFEEENIDRRKTNKIAFITMFGNLIWGSIKFIFAFLVKDFFWCVSGIYTLLIGISKVIYRIGRLRSNYVLKKEIPYYRGIAICLAVGSIMYICYMARYLILDINSTDYGTIIGIAIAVFAFVDLGIAIRNAIISNKKHDFLQSGLRLVGISSAITAIVITQIALTTTHATDGDFNKYNGIVGITAGIICFIIAIAMIINSIKKEKSLA